MRQCMHCQMTFNPELAGQVGDRGGTFTGWSLPEGATKPEPHEHEFAQCQGCNASGSPLEQVEVPGPFGKVRQLLCTPCRSLYV